MSDDYEVEHWGRLVAWRRLGLHLQYTEHNEMKRDGNIITVSWNLQLCCVVRATSDKRLSSDALCS